MKPKYNNHLIRESSPYLLQHAHNPVDWYPWGEEALEKAKAEKKLLIVSIGYAACHWCHVMEHESFEDEAVAELMNKHFVSIKVDREERPDIDGVYMDAAMIITGRGGWPLNAIAMPDGRPVYAGTYYPKENWIKVLQYFAHLQHAQPQELEKQAELVTKGIQGMDDLPQSTQTSGFTQQHTDQAAQKLLGMVDFKQGGRSGAPKFPMPSNWEFLLHYAHETGNHEALKAVEVTLRKMAYGGIFDQIGGGFARYSVDADWLVPHFEKMLYDNAQLVSLYSHAYQMDKNPLYKEVAYKTLQFIKRELTDETGGFYSSLDADSEGEEGKFYVWGQEEFNRILGEDADLMSNYYNMNVHGNWEAEKNILHRTKSDEEFAKAYGLSHEVLQEKVASANEKLLKARSERIRPGLDDKILTGWNALMIKGYVDAYRAFDESQFLEAALKCARFLLQNAKQQNYRLTRNYKKGKATINAFLDDYALVIEAFIDLYQATFDEEWLLHARHFTEYVRTNFSDGGSSFFFYTSQQDDPLVARKKELSDNVIAASNSVMALNLFKLGHYFYQASYIEQAEKMLQHVLDQVEQQPAFYSNWAQLLLLMVEQPYEVAIVGDTAQQLRKEFDRQYLPSVLFLGGADGGHLELLKGKVVAGKTLIYVCRNKSCQRPVERVDEAIPLL